MQDHTLRGEQTGNANNTERESLKEKPPTWSSYIRTTEGKSKSKFGDSEFIMQLDTGYTRSELKLNVNFSQEYSFKLHNHQDFRLTELPRVFLVVHIQYTSSYNI